jgi:hypothetical protein
MASIMVQAAVEMLLIKCRIAKPWGRCGNRRVDRRSTSSFSSSYWFQAYKELNCAASLLIVYLIPVLILNLIAAVGEAVVTGFVVEYSSKVRPDLLGQ